MSPPPSPRTYRAYRTISKLKNDKGPSPTSVMANTFDFDEAPFDCPKRASSVGNLDRMNNLNSSMSVSEVDRAYPRQQLNTSRLQPNKLPKSPYRKSHMPDIPKSPQSASKKGSTFRQRRLQLAQQRKWKDETLEKTVRSRTAVNNNVRSEHKSTISGKEKVLMEGEGTLEISISGHLEKEGYDHTILPAGNLRRYEQIDFPIQSAKNVKDDEGSQYGGAYSDNDQDAMTIDTVSSLNTMQSEMSRKSMISQGLKSPQRSPRFSRRKNTNRQTPMPREDIGVDDSLHPPMFVQSKVHRKKVSLKGSTSNVATTNEESLPMEPFSPIIEPQSSSIDGPSMDESSTSKFQSPSLLEVTEVVSNKKEGGPAMKETIQKFNTGGYGKENDIPAIDTNSVKSSKRSSPTPQMLAQDDMASMGSQMSATALRRRRLQKMQLAKKRGKARDLAVSNVPLEVSNVPLADVSIPKQEEKEEEKEAHDNTSTASTGSKNEESGSDGIQKQIIDISFGSLKISPFDESMEKPNESFNEEKLDSDLHTIADQRDFEDDERSLITSKSAQTFLTMKTCFTHKPATEEEMEKAVKKKRGRLMKLHHALTCTHPHPTKADDENYVPCPEMRHCHALCILVRHVQTCTSAKCEVPGCAQYKKVWNHYRRCILRTFTKNEKKKCKVCGDIWGNYAQDLEYSFENSVDAETSFKTIASYEGEI